MSETAEVVTKRSNGIARIEQRGGRGGRARDDARPRRAPLDPGEQEDQEQRRDRERVALLDPVGEARGERADDERASRTTRVIVDASSTCSARSSERARAVSTIAAATGITPR